MNRETLKKEALKRMTALDLYPEVIESFKNEDKLFYSERQNKYFQAVLYSLENEKILNEIKNVENEYGGLVYHVQLTHTEFGDMYSLLYVSKYDEEWEMDWENINSEVFAYVINGNIKEFGTIGICPNMGGVVRTW